jgi:hypothetical protein
LRHVTGRINGANTYQFVMGNPVGNVDPDGFASSALPPFTSPIPPGALLWTPPPAPLYQQYQQDQAMANYWENKALTASVLSQNTYDWEQFSKYQNASNNLLGQISDQLKPGREASARLRAEAAQIGASRLPEPTYVQFSAAKAPARRAAAEIARTDVIFSEQIALDTKKN